MHFGLIKKFADDNPGTTVFFILSIMAGVLFLPAGLLLTFLIRLFNALMKVNALMNSPFQ